MFKRVARQLRCSRGTSIFELLSGIVIGGLLMAVGVPQYQQLRLSFSRDSAVKQVEFDIRRIKAEAVSKNVRGVIAIAADGASYDVGLDLAPFSNPPTIETTIFHRDLPVRTSITVTGDRLYFGTRGFLVDSTNNPITGVVVFNYEGEAYATGTIYATGVFLLREFV